MKRDSLPAGAVPHALCDGAGLPECADCLHNRDQYPAGTKSQCPDWDPKAIVRDGRCRWWAGMPSGGRA